MQALKYTFTPLTLYHANISLSSSLFHVLRNNTLVPLNLKKYHHFELVNLDSNYNILLK